MKKIFKKTRIIAEVEKDTSSEQVKMPTGNQWQRNKKALAVVLIISAAIIGFVLMPMASKQNAEQAEIVQAVAEISENIVITEDMITTIKIPAKLLPENAVQDANSVIGKYAQRRIEKQDYITSTKISTSPARQEVNAIADKQIVSLTIPTAAAGVSGILEIGDLVSVWAVPKDTNTSLFAKSTLYTALGDEVAEHEAATNSEEEKNSSIYIEETEISDVDKEKNLAPENILTEPEATLYEGLEFVEVAGIYSNTAANTDYVGTDIPVTISLYVTKGQAQKLVEVEHFENLHFVFAARGENRVKYLSKEDLTIW